MKLYDAGFLRCRYEVMKMLDSRIIKGENETYHIYLNNVFSAIRDEVQNLMPQVEVSPETPAFVRQDD